MALIVALLFLVLSASLLWAGHRFPALGAAYPGRITAAFVGIWVVTVICGFIATLVGVAESDPTSTQKIGTVAVPTAVFEAFWIAVTCGLKRTALMPAICATISIALLVWIAAT